MEAKKSVISHSTTRKDMQHWSLLNKRKLLRAAAVLLLLLLGMFLNMSSLPTAVRSLQSERQALKALHSGGIEIKKTENPLGGNEFIEPCGLLQSAVTAYSEQLECKREGKKGEKQKSFLASFRVEEPAPTALVRMRIDVCRRTCEPKLFSRTRVQTKL